MKARVHVTLKPGVLDPQGKAIAACAARRSASARAGDVRQGKVIELDLAEQRSGAGARRRSTRMCEQAARQHRDRELRLSRSRRLRRHESRRHRLSRLQLRPRPRGGARGGRRAERRHGLARRRRAAARLDLIVLPGGFSYGDYLRSGAMAARSPIMREVVERARARRAGARHLQRLPDPDRGRPAARRADAQRRRSSSSATTCRSRVENAPRRRSPRATRWARCVRFPIAHHDGNYFADEETLDRLEGEGRVAFRYAPARRGRRAEANPNGSRRNIAGIFNETGTVLGLMPHPERWLTRIWAAPTAPDVQGPGGKPRRVVGFVIAGLDPAIHSVRASARVLDPAAANQVASSA